MVMTFHRPRPIAWFFFLIAFATTLALGTWQVKRLIWKEGIIAEIAAAQANAPLTLADIPSDPAAIEPLNFRPVCVAGRWGATEFHISPRFFKGKLGYFIAQPLTLTDGRVALINRGWVPVEQKLPETRPETVVKGSTELCGMLRVGNERNWLTPPNDPERNLWFGRDIDEMAGWGELKNVLPAMIDIVGTQDRANLPVPSDGTIKLRNDHLSYIITWYGIAFSILVIFLLYHRKR